MKIMTCQFLVHSFSTWAFCLSMREGNRIIRVRRHCYFELAARGFLNGRSTLWKIFCQERWEIVTKLHTFLSLWIFFEFVGSSDENILMIKSRTKRDKGPKKWSLAFDLPKFKMFTREAKWCRLVWRCWSFIVMNHRAAYWHDPQINHPLWDGHFEFELILLQLWSKFSS